jgi:hypothetical protein
MKKLFLPVFIFICTASVIAQTKIAVRGGFNYSTARITQYDIKKPGSYNGGYGLGILFKAPFDGLLHFSPYIAYNLRGYKYNTQRSPDSAFSNTISYIDIVPALSIDFPAGKNSFVLSGGFNVSVAVAGTEKITSGNSSSSKKMKFDISSGYGLFDLGLNTSIGYHMEKIFVEAGFNLGLADINNEYDKDGRNIRNRMFSFNVGYYFK